MIRFSVGVSSATLKLSLASQEVPTDGIARHSDIFRAVHILHVFCSERTNPRIGH